MPDSDLSLLVEADQVLINLERSDLIVELWESSEGLAQNVHSLTVI
jgi:hypothetical protein